MLVSVYFMTYGAINFGIKRNIMFVSEYKLGRNLEIYAVYRRDKYINRPGFKKAVFGMSIAYLVTL